MWLRYIVRPKNLRTFLYIVLPILASCGKKESEPWPWPTEGVAEVRFFFINPDNHDAFTPLVLEDGTLNPARRPIEGLILSSEQEEVIRESLFRERPPYPKAMCFYPHHSFLLLDSSGNHLGSIDLCFQCNQHGGMKGLAQYVDLSVLAFTIEQLGYPIVVEAPDSGDPFAPEGGLPGASDDVDPFGPISTKGEQGGAAKPFQRQLAE